VAASDCSDHFPGESFSGAPFGVRIATSRSWFRRWPLVITFEGPDGSGKSTLAAGLAQRMVEAGVDVRLARSRPKTTERLRATAYDHKHPHNQPQRGAVESIARVFAKYCFYLVRWAQEAKHTSEPTILIRERGWMDYLADSRRYGLSPITAPVVSVLGRFFPRSDYCFVLFGQPAAIHDRKRDLSVDEIERVIAAWKTSAPKTARRILFVDTTAVSSSEAIELLLSHIAVPSATRDDPSALRQ